MRYGPFKEGIMVMMMMASKLLPILKPLQFAKPYAKCLMFFSSFSLHLSPVRRYCPSSLYGFRDFPVGKKWSQDLNGNFPFQENPWTVLVVVYIGAVIVENQIEVSQKAKN